MIMKLYYVPSNWERKKHTHDYHLIFVRLLTALSTSPSPASPSPASPSPASTSLTTSPTSPSPSAASSGVCIKEITVKPPFYEVEAIAFLIGAFTSPITGPPEVEQANCGVELH